MSGEPPVWGGGAADGPGWSTLMAWTGLVLGVGAFVFAVAAPLWTRPAGIAWIAGFGALAIWFGAIGWLRLRRGRPHEASEAGADDVATGDADRTGDDPPSPLGAGAGLLGAVLGAATILLMAYAWAAFIAAGAGAEWPMLPAWHPDGVPGDAPPSPGDVTV
ncbi:hypothetical protein GE115_06085 [Agromyces sp. CFH 90414]|uniref:Uncharacterized protein n=1 Tax=Agromyces agglutinans TaxID=2662258 RepID=A0A6I2FBY6_9MICO|nr:hypothetical protein [Agromyces agglutinans]MRG59443.1 hypothetical protein [Agromyces agglutinans]